MREQPALCGWARDESEARGHVTAQSPPETSCGHRSKQWLPALAGNGTDACPASTFPTVSEQRQLFQATDLPTGCTCLDKLAFLLLRFI